MDVVTAAWVADGKPVAGQAGDLPPGHCARCGRSDNLTAAERVVSNRFTAVDAWADPAGQGLCPACTWSYRAPELRLLPTMVTASPPRITHPCPAQVAGILTTPVPGCTAVVVPLQPGRKHLLQTAQWGRVTTGEACLPWTAADAARLRVVTRLRAAGFGSRQLAASAPPFPVLRRLPPAVRADVLGDWEVLRPWRERPPWLSVALRITTPANTAAA